MHRKSLLSALLAVTMLFLVLPVTAWAAGGDVATSDMTELAAWSSITGVILPWVAAFILQSHWSSTVKSVLVAVAAGVDAFVVNGLTNDWSFDQGWIVSFALVFALARTTYAGLWSKVGDTSKGGAIGTLEKATTLGG